jgi:hypothetical protein
MPALKALWSILTGRGPALQGRAAAVQLWETRAPRGDKALVGNTGYRRYLKTIRNHHFAIDPRLCRNG